MRELFTLFKTDSISDEESFVGVFATPELAIRFFRSINSLFEDRYDRRDISLFGASHDLSGIYDYKIYATPIHVSTTEFEQFISYDATYEESRILVAEAIYSNYEGYCMSLVNEDYMSSDDFNEIFDNPEPSLYEGIPDKPSPQSKSSGPHSSSHSKSQSESQSGRPSDTSDEYAPIDDALVEENDFFDVSHPDSDVPHPNSPDSPLLLEPADNLSSLTEAELRAEADAHSLFHDE